MWSALSYRCDACHAYTVVQSCLVHSGACSHCSRPLDLQGRSHPVEGTAAGDAIRNSPVPVILVFTSKWSEAPVEEHQAVESLAHALSGEVTVLVADVAEDPRSCEVWTAHGRPRAVLLSEGNEIGRGTSYPVEGPVRQILARALPRRTREPTPRRSVTEGAAGCACLPVRVQPVRGGSAIAPPASERPEIRGVR